MQGHATRTLQCATISVGFKGVMMMFFLASSGSIIRTRGNVHGICSESTVRMPGCMPPCWEVHRAISLVDPKLAHVAKILHRHLKRCPTEWEKWWNIWNIPHAATCISRPLPAQFETFSTDYHSIISHLVRRTAMHAAHGQRGEQTREDP